MSYKNNFISGLAWNGGFKVFSKMLTAVKLAILYRLLSPTSFGLFSLVIVSVSLIEVFTESGINTILIQSKKKVEEYLSTAWILSIFRGFLIAFVMVFLAIGMSQYYHEPKLFNLILFASIIPIIRGFINPGIITFYKNLEFKQDTFYRLTLVITDVCTAIVFGLVLKNTFALIIPMIFSSMIEVFVSFFFVSAKPKFEFNKTIFTEILSQTKWLNGITILDYLTKNADNLIVGRYLGTTQLGFYQSAFALTQSTTAELGLSVIHASFPIYSRFSDDIVRLRRAFLKVMVAFCAVIAFPVFLFLLFPEFIVHVQFGSGWSQVVAILPILAISGYIQGVFNLGSTIFTVRKKYHFLALNLASVLLSMVTSLLFLTPTWGLIGSALSILLSRVITLPLFIWFMYFSLIERFNTKQST